MRSESLHPGAASADLESLYPGKQITEMSITHYSRAGERDLGREGDERMETKKQPTSLSLRRRLTLAIALLLLLAVGSFRKGSADAAQKTTHEQALFSTPQEAMKAVVNAAETKDRAALTAIFASESENL